VGWAQQVKEEGFLLDSVLATSPEDKKCLLDMLGSKHTLRTELLYRGSRDGFYPPVFHSLCDNKGPTYTIVRSV
jgi:hypothetical protein